jgi:hypothetical protein
MYFSSSKCLTVMEDPAPAVRTVVDGVVEVEQPWRSE